ncbi:PTS sugar transporter subunit IIA [Actinotalea solisilvae]|uniref:PTS sugar transporter subunit IIA n=1 Tax=Actinotalea solisilvae TaxID=2072922 RepID=UPI0018F16362|nr:PTS glucose transporter subunit IIA [Actinotalea solisilvae]
MRDRLDRSTLQVVAPMAGTVVDLADVPDPVYSGAVVGPGLAILPDEPAAPAAPAGSGLPVVARVVVVAPCPGRVSGVYPHALMIQADHDRSVLVHLGLDTSQLEGQGFDVATADGDRVERGQPVLAWSPADVRGGGRSTLCPLVALQAQPEDVVLLVEAGDAVVEGQPVLLWS